MFRKIRLISLTLLVFLPLELMAQSGRYHLIASNVEYDVHLDQQRISRAGNTIEAWTRARPKNQQPAHYMEILNRLDCSARRLTVLRVVARDANNGSTLQTEDMSDGQIQRIIPGSVAEDIWHFLCANPTR